MICVMLPVARHADVQWCHGTAHCRTSNSIVYVIDSVLLPPVDEGADADVGADADARRHLRRQRGSDVVTRTATTAATDIPKNK